MNEIDILRWIHILAMVYWLGGEWGVFQSSYFVTDHKLPMDERRRHMETAYKIDILARTGITLLLPLGLHMGVIYGFVPSLDGYLTIMWLIFFSILAVEYLAFFYRETDLGIRYGKIVEVTRYMLILGLLVFGALSLRGIGPIEAAPGTYWYPAKMLVFGSMLVIGLALRYIMREWTLLFRLLEQGPNQAAEDRLTLSISRARMMAYCYWVGIAGTGFLGAVKPF